MIFVDTNYFLRFLLKDNPQHEIAKKLFLEAAEGKISLTASVIVFFEIYWVLSSYYNRQKKDVAETLEKILKLTFIKFAQRDILSESVEVFKNTTLSLEDAYNLAWAKSNNITSFKTFDVKLEKYFHSY